MEIILFLAHTEADGSVAKASLEALGTAKVLHGALAGSKLPVGLVGETVQTAANGLAACAASRFLGVAGPDFAQARYGADAAAASHPSLEPGVGGRSAATGRSSGYPRQRGGGQRRCAHREPMVLPATDGGRAPTAPTPVVHSPGPGQPTRLARRARHRQRGSHRAPPDRGVQAHDGGRPAPTGGRCPNHPSRGRPPVCGRRRLDQEAGRRPAPREGRREADFRLSQAQPRVTGQQQEPGGPRRRGARPCFPS